MTVALRERLHRMRSAEGLEQARKEMTMSIGRDVAARLSPDLRTVDLGELLYDELGLPR